MTFQKPIVERKQAPAFQSDAQVMPKSAIMKSRNSSGFMRGLKIKAVAAERLPSHCMNTLSSVVLPVPTSPVNNTKPLPLVTTYARVARASLIGSVTYRNRGSGFRLNGASREIEMLFVHKRLHLGRSMFAASLAPFWGPPRGVKAWSSQSD